jgi:hypothetical protein
VLLHRTMPHAAASGSISNAAPQTIPALHCRAMVEAVSPAKSIEMLQNYCADPKVGAGTGCRLSWHCMAGQPCAGWAAAVSGRDCNSSPVDPSCLLLLVQFFQCACHTPAGAQRCAGQGGGAGGSGGLPSGSDRCRCLGQRAWEPCHALPLCCLVPWHPHLGP